MTVHNSNDALAAEMNVPAIGKLTVIKARERLYGMSPRTGLAASTLPAGLHAAASACHASRLSAI